jgi:hypothetical protein
VGGRLESSLESLGNGFDAQVLGANVLFLEASLRLLGGCQAVHLLHIQDGLQGWLVKVDPRDVLLESVDRKPALVDEFERRHRHGKVVSVLSGEVIGHRSRFLVSQVLHHRGGFVERITLGKPKFHA